MTSIAKPIASARDRTGTRAIARAWVRAWARPRFRVELVVTAVALTSVLGLLSRVLLWVERRPGRSLHDPVLAWLAPRDVTWLIFGLIYFSVVAAVASLSARPKRLLVGVQAYALLMTLRMIAMYLTPLDAPEGMILLRDPFAERVLGASALTKDLFFSGHTSTLFLLFLGASGRRMKALLLASTIAVGFALLWQHVHYAMDVFAAPCFAYASYEIASWHGHRIEAPAPATSTSRAPAARAVTPTDMRRSA